MGLLLETAERTATVQALTVCSVFRLKSDAFARILEEDADLQQLVLRELGKKMEGMRKKSNSADFRTIFSKLRRLSEKSPTSPTSVAALEEEEKRLASIHQQVAAALESGMSTIIMHKVESGSDTSDETDDGEDLTTDDDDDTDYDDDDDSWDEGCIRNLQQQLELRVTKAERLVETIRTFVAKEAVG
eukprot:NODE_5246_length_700_cov_29.961598_g4873_i0.p1 GENE.NODE_5246_length_700_cov_29.961598_g4873_i0~~NODE_5246_length_700_cov_29.961598_g4873_i0.p1  ORF type:complete len:188 (-),score=51.15 NODE_5246_length_700_cov_29.961598_g4873_i0:110-673(-)